MLIPKHNKIVDHFPGSKPDQRVKKMFDNIKRNWQTCTCKLDTAAKVVATILGLCLQNAARQAIQR